MSSPGGNNDAHAHGAMSSNIKTVEHDQPAFPEPTASWPRRHFTLASLRSTFNHGHRPTVEEGEEGLKKLEAPSKRREEWNLFLSRKWAVTFAAVACVEAIICLAFEIFVYVKLGSTLRMGLQNNYDKQVEIIPTFLPLFIFGFLYMNVLVWDALRAKNTIQIIGACFANFAMVIYTAIQVDQIKTALILAEAKKQLRNKYSADSIFAETKPYLLAITCIIAVSTIIMVFAAWKLYQEFSWSVLKIIGADYAMKKRFLCYQIYIGLLKFDFFFVIGFMIQLVIVVTDPSDPEFGLTIAAMPITIGILVAAAICTRKEIRWGMEITIVIYLGALSYFVFKSARIMSPQPIWQIYYKAVKKPLGAFAIITMVLILITIFNAICCISNFGKGLKDYFGRRNQDTADQEMGAVGDDEAKPRTSRITIE